LDFAGMKEFEELFDFSGILIIIPSMEEVHMIIVKDEMVKVVAIYNYLGVMQASFLQKMEVVIHEGCQS
jgi:hypothetical protein